MCVCEREREDDRLQRKAIGYIIGSCRQRQLVDGPSSGMLQNVSIMQNLTASQTCGATESLFGRHSPMGLSPTR